VRGFIRAAVTIGLCAVTLGTTPTPSAVADVQCSEQHGPNPGKAESYRAQYSSAVSEPLKRDLAAYHAAAAAGDPTRTGRSATILYSEIQTDQAMFTDQTWFGCYDSGVLTSLLQSGDAFASTLDDISSAAAGYSGKTADDVPQLVAQAGPQEKAYTDS
jgi:hypothetical protein